MNARLWTKPHQSRRTFVGGSDARIIMGSDEAALVRLWREKRGEAMPEDLSGNLVVQLAAATEDLNRSWYERATSRRVSDVQRIPQVGPLRWGWITHGLPLLIRLRPAVINFAVGAFSWRCRPIS